MAETKKSFKYRRWHCSLCDVFANSRSQYNQHLEGLGHRHKITIRNKEKNLAMMPESGEINYAFYIPTFLVVVITTYMFCYLINLIV